MKRDDWTVGDEGIRPAGKPDRCFYCGRARGEQHAVNCVIRKRTAVVRVSFEIVMGEVESSDMDNIEFYYNESSYCLDNIVPAIQATLERMNEAGRCLCGIVHIEYVREATEDDERDQGLRVADFPS